MIPLQQTAQQKLAARNIRLIGQGGIGGIVTRVLGGCPRISASDPLSFSYACGSYIQMANILDVIPLCKARVASQEV